MYIETLARGRALVLRKKRTACGTLLTEVIFVFIYQQKAWIRSRIQGYNYRSLNSPGRDLGELN
jgi:hypothetical protein